MLTTSQPVESTSVNLLDTMVNPDPTTMALTAASSMTPRGKSITVFVFGATFQSLMTYLCTDITQGTTEGPASAHPRPIAI